ncbi:MAG: hypothetical protein CMJ59_17395, partial [Planctomycetaceae bacterium]|nr:hypothetical protein [Planctomycetaceae bacterium]
TRGIEIYYLDEDHERHSLDVAARENDVPRAELDALQRTLARLRVSEAGAHSKTLASTLHELAESIKRRSLVIVISDLFDDPDELVGALKHFRHKKHDVIVFQTLDPAELTFPFDDVSRIEDMETGREITSDPRAFRVSYLEELERFLQIVRGGCRAANIDYEIAETNLDIGTYLGAYLAKRQNIRR